MTGDVDIPAGFADKVLSAQSTFRALMQAMARPGSVHRLADAVSGPGGVMPGTAAITLTMFDHDTAIWLDPRLAAAPEVGRWLSFHTGAPLATDPSACTFALIGDPAALPDLDRFQFGSDDYPDRSTTLILQIESLMLGPPVELRGPGIASTATLRAAIEPRDLLDRLAVNHSVFPRGIDVILVADDAIAAIPRTTRLVGMGG